MSEGEGASGDNREGTGDREAALLARLMEASGGLARVAGAEDAVCGVGARFVATPADTAQTSALMRVVAEAGLVVVAKGAGTKLDWGAAPEKVDVVIETTRMSRILEHAAGDLIVRVQAGVSLSSLQVELAPSGQRLALDPIVGLQSTAGGTVATALSGPLRLSHGGVRDLLIGVTIVRADGTVAKAGGKVVKNVAGYDLCRLLAGSWGTLGLITEATFRLHPRPERAVWLVVGVTGSKEVQATLQALINSDVVPSAIELDWTSGGQRSLAVLIEGTAAGVDARAAAVRGLLGSEASQCDDPPGWWGSHPWSPGMTGVRVTHQIDGLESLLGAIESLGPNCCYRGSPAVGLGFIGLEVGSSASGVGESVAHLRDEATNWGGEVVVLDAVDAVRQSVDMWGPVNGFEVMKRLKAEFDPKRILAPGRFVGGL